jgi:hypothetical protein
VKPSRTAGESTSVALPEPGGPLQAWARFWFTPIDTFGLHLVRLTAGLVLLAWLLPVAGDVPALFGLDGWFDRQAYVEANRLTGGPPKPIGWSPLYLAGANPGLLLGLYWGAVAVLALFTLGLFTRLTAPLAWLVVVTFTAVPLFDDDTDALLLLLTLYLAVGYLLLGLRGGSLSWPERLFGSWRASLFGRLLPGADQPAEPSVAANVVLRLIQVHLAIVLVTTGLHKLQFGDWWSGVAPWFLLHPPMEANPIKLRQQITDPGWYVAQLNVMAYATLAWQIGFPLLAWRRGLARLVLFGGAVAGWVGTATLYQAPLFGPALFAGCLAFVSADEWQALGRLFAKVYFLRGVGTWMQGPHTADRLLAREPGVREGAMR